MKGPPRPWVPASKLGGLSGTGGAKPLPPSAPGGMKASKSSTSLAFDSRLSKLKRASSEDTLAKPALVTVPGATRLKKTVTAGAISQLAENRLRPATGSIPTSKRTGIPAPREPPPSSAREKAAVRPRKAQPAGPASPGTPAPAAKPVRPALKPKNEAGAGAERAGADPQVKELLAEAKAKDAEVARLRAELRRRAADLPEKDSRGVQQELLALREENRRLKEKLHRLDDGPAAPASDALSSEDGSLRTPTTCDSSFGSPTGPPPPCPDGPPLPASGSSSSDVTKASLSPDASDFEHLAEGASRPRPAGVGSGSLDGGDLSSVASLTERLQRMEESHHCTAEELQATLQELSDQQQMVQELTAETERLAEEKAAAEGAGRQQRERAERLAAEKEALEALLGQRAPEAVEAQEAESRAEREQRWAQAQEKARFEREKLLGIQQQLTASLRRLERDHQGSQALAQSLKEEAGRLAALLEAERQSGAAAAKAQEDCKVALEGLRIENGSLRAQLESQRQRAVAVAATAAEDPTSSRPGDTDVWELLAGAQAERDRLERACTELRQELLKAHSEVKSAQREAAKAESECGQLAETCKRQAEQLHQADLRLQEKTSENEAEIKNLKDTIFELEDQVEQHRAVKLHDNQLLRDLEDNLMKLEEQKADLERQLKILNRQIKEDTEEWRRFQADLQTAVVVANDIKCEVQQELRAVKRRLQEEEEKSARLQKELDEAQGGGGSRPSRDPKDTPDAGPAPLWPGVVPASRLSPTPPESLATVKSLIKSFDLGAPGSGSGPGSPVVHKVARSPLSGIPTRSAPAAAVSPIQRHSTGTAKPPGKAFSKHADLPDLPLADLLKGRGEDLKPDPFLRKSPSLESLSKPPGLTLAGRMLSPTPSGLRPPSKLSAERKDPLAALAREYGGSKRNALLKWCQKKTEGYPNIDVTNFSSSWSDGLAFCALLHTYLPAHIPYHELNSQDKKRNLLLAFQAAESVGIKPSLELSEIMYTDRPDWQSVMQYVGQIYKYFET